MKKLWQALKQNATRLIAAGFFLLFSFTLFVQNLLGNAKEVAGILREPGAGFNAATIGAVEAGYNENFAHKLGFIDLHGALQRAMGKREVGNFDTVKAADGKLLPGLPGSNVLMPRQHFAAEDFAYLQKVNEHCASKGTAFVYMKTPNDVIEGYTRLPTGVVSHQNANDDELLALFRQLGVDVLDLRQSMVEDGVDPAGFFFTTDHHWTIESAFWAQGALLRHLEGRGLEFPLMERNTDLANFEVQVYEDWFLGSAGRRTGRYYGGLDDFSLILPAFDTELTHTAPSRFDAPVTGSFEEVLVDKGFLGFDSSYQLSRYDAYLRSFTPLRVIENEAGAGRVLVVQDSFGQPVSAFLALSCAEVTVLDFRYYTEMSLLEYLEQNGPYDAVVVVNQLGAGYFV